MRLVCLLALMGASLAALALPKATEVKVGEVSPAVWYSWRELGRADVWVTQVTDDPMRTVWVVQPGGEVVGAWRVTLRDNGNRVGVEAATDPTIPVQATIHFAAGARLVGKEITVVGGLHIIEQPDGRVVVQRDTDQRPLGEFAECADDTSQSAMLRGDNGKWSLVTPRGITGGFDEAIDTQRDMSGGRLAFIGKVGGKRFAFEGGPLGAPEDGLRRVYLSGDGTRAVFTSSKPDGWYLHARDRAFGPYVGDELMEPAPSGDGQHVGLFVRRGETDYAYQDMRNLGPVSKFGRRWVDDSGRPVYVRDTARGLCELMVGDTLAAGPFARETQVFRMGDRFWTVGRKDAATPGSFVTGPGGKSYGPFEQVSLSRVSDDGAKWAFTGVGPAGKSVYTHTGAHGPYADVTALALNPDTGHWMALACPADGPWQLLHDGKVCATDLGDPRAYLTAAGSSVLYEGKQADGWHIGMSGGKDYLLDTSERATVLLSVGEKTPVAVIPRTVDGAKVESLWVAGEWAGDYAAIQGIRVIGNAVYFGGWRDGVLYWVRQPIDTK